jgi:ABC-type transport system involved in multi-copper enzyme maturation permease subunit
MRTLAIAGATFKEAVSGKAYHIVILYLLVLVACQSVLVPLALGAGEKVSKDFGFSAMSVLTVIAAVMLGANVLRQSEEKKSLSFYLSKPVRRYELLLGKYLGVNGAVLSALTLMAVALALFLLYQVGSFESQILKVAALNALELVIIVAIILFFSSFSAPFVTVTSALALYVAGHFRYDLKSLAEHTESAVTRVLCDVIYYIIPNLEIFNIRGEVVHGVDVPWVRLGLAAVYACLYAGAFLGLALLVFARRDLT